MEKEKKIYVFADFLPFQNELIGTIYVSQTRGKEFYSFEYVESWLEKGNRILDPDLQLYKGRQYITMIRRYSEYLPIPALIDGDSV
mgnify:CR=1 FL=1